MSTFDPNAFEEQIITDVSATHMTPVPEGSDYKAIIDDYKFAEVAIKGEKQLVLNVFFKLLEDPRLEEVGLSADMAPVRHTLWLNLRPDGGIAYGPNQNVGLGKLRQALGLNKPNMQWSQLRGAGPVSLTIAHRADKNDPEVLYTDIKRIDKVK